MPGNVFISYRREDTAGYAGRLYDRLKAAFPGKIFIDVGEIPPGADFAKAIEKHIEGCAALVALIGKNWSTSDRLQDPDDFVRLEIAGALKRDISVIPVLVGGAKLPAAGALPEDIGPLLRRQTISISDEDWEGGCQRLIRALRMVLGPSRRQVNPAARWGIGLAAAIVLVLALVLFLRARMAGPAANTSQTPPATMPQTTRAAADYDKSVAKGYDNAAQVMGDIANKIGGAGNAAAPTAPISASTVTQKPTPSSLSPDKLKRYVTFAVSGTLQQGYAFSGDSKVTIDRETGLEVDSNIAVVGPNTKEVFTARAAYNLDSMWQWQSQGSLGGTLDFQNKPRTFVGYSGGAPLTNSAYNTPALGHIITSSDTILKPIASVDTYP